ncbi:hypothetical protein ACIQMR_18900 [Streptomyces sp. NPDC091376]|uniref:hypothetical protein n=1 Tax=Streptomyces sp. NPDC091376 TaxID=3365994 RepID=UPI00380260C5
MLVERGRGLRIVNELAQGQWGLLAGPAVLTTFRRAARKARFRAPVRFADPRTADSESR